MAALPNHLPVSQILPQLRQELNDDKCVLLQAPPGAGKTTLVPLDLLQADFLTGKKILLLEPRRLAARSVARRMAGLLGEEVGVTVGWRMQLDTRVSAKTRIEVVTEGVLTRMLQSDPSLEGVGLVIFDEFHERSLQADLGLALALQCQEGYREEDNPLKILVMSATLATAEIAGFLNCPVIKSEGKSYPVTCYYRERPLAKREARGVAIRDKRELISQCASTIQTALSRHDGSVLVFLPGVGEIRQVAQALESGSLSDALSKKVRIHQLYGDLDKQAQDQAIQPAPEGLRKIVLTTAIAESSLTIEGVHIVVDAGLTRTARFNPRTGMSSLDTIRVSRASAEQRAGRAGRLAPGHCYRLWTETEQQQLMAHSAPEIVNADLSALTLELLAWGVSDPNELEWLTPVPAPAFARAMDLLEQLGAVRKNEDQPGITRHGQRMAELGLHPRLAHMVLMAKKHDTEWLAAQLCVLLSERDPLAGVRDAGSDINLRLSLLEGQAIPGITVSRSQINHYKQLSRQWQKRLGLAAHRKDYQTDDIALLLACAYPDRVAQRRSHNGRYLMSSGQGVTFRDAESLSAEDYLVIPSLGGHSHQREALIYLACPVTTTVIERLFHEQIDTIDDIRWDKKEKAVIANRVDKFKAITLSSKAIKNLNPDIKTKGLMSGIREMGLSVLPWDKASEGFRYRIQCLYGIDDSWPDFSDQALLNTLEEWLAPFLAGMSRLEHLKQLNMTQCLQAATDWSRLQELDKQAPEKLEVPSGSHIPIDYSNPQEPILAVKLQELFGLSKTPELAYGKVPLTIELLSPAQRPVQKTQDLESFWNNTYQEVKKELKGRYPKHWWPDNPWDASPTSGCKPKK